jgi:hypothetical protein
MKASVGRAKLRAFLEAGCPQADLDEPDMAGHEPTHQYPKNGDFTVFQQLPHDPLPKSEAIPPNRLTKG